MRKLSLLPLFAAGLLGCSNQSAEFPKTFVACYEKALLETKHNGALFIAIEHCEKMDAKGAAAYNGNERKTQPSMSPQSQSK